MRNLHVLALACLLAACGGKNKTEGDADADAAVDTPAETTDDTPADPATEPTTDPTEDPAAETVDDPTTDPEEDAEEDPVTDTATDTASDPGADTSVTCDTTKLHSAGIAPSPWGVGSFCDEIYACISSGATSVVTSIFPSATCGTTFSSCTSGDVCEIYSGGTLTTTDYANVCALSLQDTVFAIWCIVYA